MNKFLIFIDISLRAKFHFLRPPYIFAPSSPSSLFCFSSHRREVRIFAGKNSSQQITVKTLKNSWSVVVNTFTLCSYNFWQGAGFESCSVPFLFFLLSFSFLFRFRFCFVCLFVLLLMFFKYIPSRAKIVYLWINNLNFYRFLQFSFLFYCDIFYKTKTVATCSYKLRFIIYVKFWLLIFAFGTRGLFWT